jgi:hypothetical protein
LRGELAREHRRHVFGVELGAGVVKRRFAVQSPMRF